jgi:hypothetical protein
VWGGVIVVSGMHGTMGGGVAKVLVARFDGEWVGP